MDACFSALSKYNEDRNAVEVPRPPDSGHANNEIGNSESRKTFGAAEVSIAAWYNVGEHPEVPVDPLELAAPERMSSTASSVCAFPAIQLRGARRWLRRNDRKLLGQKR